MVHVIRTTDSRPKGRTVLFEGDPFGAEVSFFSVDNAKGEGPPLHVHPYPETWIVQDGRARLVAGSEAQDIEAGDVAVVPANTPHKFTNLGPGRLRMICIHPRGTIVQRDLE
jgi:mannose-6-phosphate isomerase-like protein (cupin superfamily)